MGVQCFRGALVFKAHRLAYHTTVVLRVTKKERKSLSKTGSRQAIAQRRDVFSSLNIMAGAGGALHVADEQQRSLPAVTPSTLHIKVFLYITNPRILSPKSTKGLQRQALLQRCNLRC